MGDQTDTTNNEHSLSSDYCGRTQGSPLPITGRQTWAEVDLQALKENYKALCSLLHPPERTDQHSHPYPRIIPVIKTNAYGHGADAVARALSDSGAGIFSIGLVEEGIALRESGISRDLLVLGTNWTGQESDAIRHGLILAVDSAKSLESLDKAAGNLSAAASIHIKIDTGMGRLGMRWDSVNPLLNALHASKNIALKGFFSHLSSADEENPAYSRDQKRKFEEVLSGVRKASIDPGEIHFANSAGFLYHESFRHWSARTGIALYGYTPDPQRYPVKLRPVLTLKTRIGPIRQVQPGESIGYGRRFTASRTTRYSTLPIGYADGFNRKLGNNSCVIIRDGLADVIGTVSMDMIAVDLTDRPDVQEGDEVILLGAGNRCSITAADWAETLETIPYEILCGIASRIPRIYI